MMLKVNGRHVSISTRLCYARLSSIMRAPTQMVKTLKFCNFNFVMEGMRCFNILRLQELGVGLDGFSILGLGVKF